MSNPSKGSRMLKFSTSTMSLSSIEASSLFSSREDLSLDAAFEPRTMAYIFSTDAREEMVSRRAVPKEPVAPVRRMISFSGVGKS